MTLTLFPCLPACTLSFSSSFLVIQEKIAKFKSSDNKLEEDKKQLRVSLDDAENRCTKIELSRRALEGELQRMRLTMNDKETENQVR